MISIPDVELNLRKMLLTMKLAPGEILTQRWAESYFHASRSLVRTAFKKMMTEGLIYRDGGHWVVAQIQPREVEQLYVYREVLEIAALNISARTITEEELRSIEAIFLTEHSREVDNIMQDAGTQFHLQLAVLCGNTFIIEGLRHALYRLARARRLDNSPINPAWDEHRNIINALRMGNIDMATEILTQHLRESHFRLQKIICTDPHIPFDTRDA